MNLKDFRVDGKGEFRLKRMPTDAKGADITKEEAKAKTAENLEKMAALQDAMYADGREGLIVVLQAMDAAGKDGTVKHVMTALNPQGMTIHSFKQPTSEELAHDFLWRVNKCLPSRGSITIMNRSYYEDVLVVNIHDIQKDYHMAERVIDVDKEKFFKRRYRHIRNYEKYLYDNSYRVVKIFLNLSMEEQKKRFLERIDRPEKNWKFSSADIRERQHFEDYMELFQEVIQETATEESPWYCVPADKKWYTRYLVSEIMVEALKQCSHTYPVLDEEERARLEECRQSLLNE